ncbi:MAG: hypothetical protein V1752_04855, partial [Candidatus Firestonebacteria bacterium]
MRLQINKIIAALILASSFFYGEASPEMIEQWLKGDNAAIKEIGIKEIGKRKLEKFVPQLKELLITELKKEEVKVEIKNKEEKGKKRPKWSKEKDNEKQKEEESEKLRTAAAAALANFKGDKEIPALLCSVLEKNKYMRSLRMACIR